MSHGDHVVSPSGFKLMQERNPPIAAMSNEDKLYAVQFHPEVRHSVHGNEMIKNFLYEVCECEGNWSMETLSRTRSVKSVKSLASKSAVRAERRRGFLRCGHADPQGNRRSADMHVHRSWTLRKGEAESVMETFVGKFDMKVVKIDAQERFMSKLKGVDDPEKRKIIGNEFIYVFDEESSKFDDFAFLAQGTLYTDIVESGTDTAHTIKSHHNVGGLPEDMKFTLIEPLKLSLRMRFVKSARSWAYRMRSFTVSLSLAQVLRSAYWVK